MSSREQSDQATPARAVSAGHVSSTPHRSEAAPGAGPAHGGSGKAAARVHGASATTGAGAAEHVPASSWERRSASPAGPEHSRHRDVSALLQGLNVSSAQSKGPHAAPVVQNGVCPVNPRAALEQQRAREWKSPSDVVRNLRDNGDLGTWSRDQLRTLDRLADTSPAWDKRVTKGVARYASGADRLDRIPSTPVLQKLLHERVLDGADGRCKISTPEVKAARAHLENLVDEKVTGDLEQRLRGAEGDEALERSLAAWVGDVRKAQLRQPALASYLERGAEQRAADYHDSGRFEDVRRADDGFFRQVGNGFSDVTSGVGAGAGWVGDRLHDLSERLPEPLRPIVGLDRLAGAARFAQGMVAGLGQSGAYKGMAKMAWHGLDANPITLAIKSGVTGKSPQEILGDDAHYFENVAKAMVAPYQDVNARYGPDGVVGYVAAEILTAVATEGVGTTAKAALVARATKVGDFVSATSLGQRIATRVGVRSGALVTGEARAFTAALSRGRRLFDQVRAARNDLPPGFESIVKTAGSRSQQQSER